jgi:histone H3/H4
MLRRTPLEERLIGLVCDLLREEAVRLGREAVERAQHSAKRTIDSSAEVVRDAIDEPRRG